MPKRRRAAVATDAVRKTTILLLMPLRRGGSVVAPVTVQLRAGSSSGDDCVAEWSLTRNLLPPSLASSLLPL